MVKSKSKSKQIGAVATLAGTVVTTIGAIAVNGGASSIVFAAFALIFFVFTAVLWYQVWTDRADQKGSKRNYPDLDPRKFAASLDAQQTNVMKIAFQGAVADIANQVKVKPENVRANLFSLLPGPGPNGKRRLRMVDGLTYNMEHRPEELTMEMDVGEGCSGRAFQSGRPNRAIWKDGWGPDDIGDDEQLKKAHPELRWIISVPLCNSSNQPLLIFNVDGLRDSPSRLRLGEATVHAIQFGTGISVGLGLPDYEL